MAISASTSGIVPACGPPYAPVADLRRQLRRRRVQTLESGVPYGAVGAIDTIPYANDPGYLNPERRSLRRLLELLLHAT